MTCIILYFYLLLSVVAMAGMALTASGLRRLHQMSPISMSWLTVAAGFLWPLLLIAVVQAIGLLALKGALGAIRLSRGQDPKIDGYVSESVALPAAA